MFGNRFRRKRFTTFHETIVVEDGTDAHVGRESFRDAHIREDGDRIRLMINSLDLHIEKLKKRAETRIADYRMSGDAKRQKMIPAEQGLLRELVKRFEGKKAELRLKGAATTGQDSAVSSGVIRVV